MAGWAFDEETARRTAQLSGVHETPTQPAPYIDELEEAAATIGSIPRAELSAEFQPIVDLHTGRNRGFEVLARCTADGLSEAEQLFARASFEKTVAELGRAIREIGVRECAGAAIFLSVQPDELKDGWLVRPDDPICAHDSEIFLQISQQSVVGLPALVLGELAGRNGVRLVLDDFGSGPATLKQVVDLAPQGVKIGRELIAGIDKNARKQIAVTRLCALCRDLGAEVFAKGVDCREEAETAWRCGVRCAQGYAFGDPSPLPTIAVWTP